MNQSKNYGTSNIRQKQETKLYDKTIKQRKLENKNLLEVKNMRQKGI